MNVLILAPHTDDGEFGCGGTISRMTSHNHNVYYVAFSAAKNLIVSQNLPIPIDTLEKEVSRATKILGIPKQNLKIYDFPIRNFLQHRQKILDTMVLLNEELKPDLVFLPSTTETHQDHQVISDEGFRAFKKTTIFGYELPWNNLSFKTDVFITLEEEQIQNKVESILESGKYETLLDCIWQFPASPPGTGAAVADPSTVIVPITKIQQIKQKWV